MLQKRKAFTLVELLVVIGIIALLISILLPAMNKARATAKLISCGSNLHQIFLSYSMYQTDFKGYYPALWGYQGWAGQVTTDFDQMNDGVAVMQAYMSKYGKQRMWICPSDDYYPHALANTDLRQISYFPNEMAWKGALPYLPTAVANTYTTENTPTVCRAIKPNVIHHAYTPNSETIMLAEGIYAGQSDVWYQNAKWQEYKFYTETPVSWNPGGNGFGGRRSDNVNWSDGNDDNLVFRHYNDSSGANCLYFDGHVKAVSYKDVQKVYRTLYVGDFYIHPPGLYPQPAFSTYPW